MGTGIDLSIGNLAKEVANAVGFKGSIQWDKSKPDGTPKKQLDVSRIASMGWRARIKLREGLTMAYDDYRSQIRAGTLKGPDKQISRNLKHLAIKL